jgi:hypothetical protein
LSGASSSNGLQDVQQDDGFRKGSTHPTHYEIIEAFGQQRPLPAIRLLNEATHQSLPRISHSQDQTEKNSARANAFRFVRETGHCPMQSACLQ